MYLYRKKKLKFISIHISALLFNNNCLIFFHINKNIKKYFDYFDTINIAQYVMVAINPSWICLRLRCLLCFLTLLAPKPNLIQQDDFSCLTF